jgi:ABC-type nitrate/sulfonate/bicarbonate transport system permease component
MSVIERRGRSPLTPSPTGEKEQASSSPSPRGRGGQGVRSAWRALWPALVAFAGLLLLWQWATAGERGFDRTLYPTPVAVFQTLIAQRGPLWANTLVTLEETLVGFFWAFVAGVAFAVVIDRSPWLRRALYPLLVASQTIPLITLAPLLVLWFGFGLLSKVVVVTLVCFFPITVGLADGLRGADPDLIKLYRAFGAGWARLFWSVRLPGALPSLFSGARIGVTYSVVGAIFGEYVAADAGLGYFMTLKQHSFSTAGVLATVVVTALLSVALFRAVAIIERLALPWYYAQSRESAT